MTVLAGCSSLSVTPDTRKKLTELENKADVIKYSVNDAIVSSCYSDL